MENQYDAILIVSFGGPEKREDVMPFLENVLRGKPVPRERMLEVAEHYYHFGGVSPINAQTRALIDALRGELAGAGVRLPLYWGTRNWHPLLTDTVRTMQADGVRRAVAWVASAFGSYSGCRQYLENIAAAQEAAGPAAPRIDKLRLFFNHPGFIEAAADRLAEALRQLPPEHRDTAPLLFTAHSIPSGMAGGCPYVAQLTEACRLISERVRREPWQLVYQSRSGPPSQPWLEPDVCQAIRQRHERDGCQHLVLAPIGFLSDHVEVLFDLDVEARAVCDQLGIHLVRAGTVGTHPRFVRTLRELIMERLDPQAPRRALGTLGPSPDVCPDDCCRYTPRRG